MPAAPLPSLAALPALCAVAFLAVSAAAEDLGDARAGLAYADKACTSCHAIRSGEAASPNPDAPSFQSVANSDGMTERALGVWFQTSHPTMPNLVIPRDDLDNVIAYIMSLKTTKK